jgi:hypothetical protein
VDFWADGKLERQRPVGTGTAELHTLKRFHFGALHKNFTRFKADAARRDSDS